MRKRYRLSVHDEASNIVYLPTEIYSRNEGIKKLAFGSQTAEAVFQEHNYNTILLSKELAKQLNIPFKAMPAHTFLAPAILHLGPLVGIFTSGFTPFLIKPIGERSYFFAKLLEVQKEVGAIPFVFGEQHIDWERGMIQGLFRVNQEWKTLHVPFPDVVYDRLPNRKTEKREAQQRVKRMMQADYLIPWYNPGFFNKLDIHDILVQVSSVSHYLPESIPFVSTSDIERMLAHYGHVFVKPINGSLGNGIHQILLDKETDSYYCRFRDREDRNKLLKFPHLEGLINRIFIGKSLNSLLIQQGIHLIRYEGKQVDFRVHTNKNEHGDWVVTAIAAKIAGPGSVTTHVKSGGEIKTIAEVFPIDEEREAVNTTLTEAALNLSEAIEQNMQGVIGEIGFDLGVDRNGKVWFFEANSKPGRSIFHHPGLAEFDFLTRKLSLAFAIFLAEQAIHNPEEIFR